VGNFILAILGILNLAVTPMRGEGRRRALRGQMTGSEGPRAGR
jgi:hypothetical protein